MEIIISEINFSLPANDLFRKLMISQKGILWNYRYNGANWTLYANSFYKKSIGANNDILVKYRRKDFNLYNQPISFLENEILNLKNSEVSKNLPLEFTPAIVFLSNEYIHSDELSKWNPDYTMLQLDTYLLYNNSSKRFFVISIPYNKSDSYTKQRHTGFIKLIKDTISYDLINMIPDFVKRKIIIEPNRIKLMAIKNKIRTESEKNPVFLSYNFELPFNYWAVYKKFKLKLANSQSVIYSDSRQTNLFFNIKNSYFDGNSISENEILIKKQLFSVNTPDFNNTDSIEEEDKILSKYYNIKDNKSIQIKKYTEHLQKIIHYSANFVKENTSLEEFLNWSINPNPFLIKGQKNINTINKEYIDLPTGKWNNLLLISPDSKIISSKPFINFLIYKNSCNFFSSSNEKEGYFIDLLYNGREVVENIFPEDKIDDFYYKSGKKVPKNGG